MGKLIIVKTHEEIAPARIEEAISSVENNFFSNPNNPNREFMKFPISDGYHQFSKEDIETIRRLNNQPNLFGINFDISISSYVSDTSGCGYHHLVVGARRVA